MQNILCATDFSENARNAVLYAANLAMDQGIGLTLYHAYHNYGPLISSKEVAIEQPLDTNHGPGARKKMDQLINEVKSLHPSLAVGHQVEEVNVLYGIREFLKQHPVDLVIVGSKGQNEIKEVFFGGTAMEAMHELPCPVLAIPQNAVYRKPENIVFAAELEDRDLEVAKRLTKFAAVFNANVYLAHFFEEENMINQQDADNFKKALGEQINYPKLTTTAQTYGNLTEFIDQKIRDHHADILVMREREHGLFHDLFHKDVVAKFLRRSDLPLLVFNDLLVAQE